MDHVVYLDAKSREFEKLLDGSKTMIIRGATGRKLPYGRVNEGDILFFINNNAILETDGKKLWHRVLAVHFSPVLYPDDFYN